MYLFFLKSQFFFIPYFYFNLHSLLCNSLFPSCSLVLFPLISSPSSIFLFSIFLFVHISSSLFLPPHFHSSSFLSLLVFSYFPVSCLLSTFPLFIFPPSTFLLPSLFLSPFFYSHYFLVCLNFFYFVLCTPPLFLLWLATFLGFFTAFVTLPAVCGRQDPGNVTTLFFLFHVLYMIHLPGKKAYGIGQILAGPEAVVGHA